MIIHSQYYLKLEMESNSKTWWEKVLLRLFINRNTIPPYLQIIQTCIQTVLYIAIINGFPLGNNLFSQATANIAISLILIGVVLVRLLSGLSIIKFVYVPILSYTLSTINSSSSSIPFIVIVGICIIIDIVSSISFDFYSQNLSAQNLNVCKMLHYGSITFGISQTILGNNFIIDGVCIGIFMGLWLFKRASICRSRTFKEFLLLAYLWMTVSHLMVMIANWITMPLLVKIGLPLAFTQIALKIYLDRKSTAKLDELYSQENYLKMAFELMIYVHGENYSSQMEKQIQAFLVNRQYSSLKDAQKRRLIYEKLIDILSKRNSYEEQLITAQIYLFYDHQLLKSKIILNKISSMIGYSSWIRRLCAFRVQQTLHEVYRYKNKQIHFAHYEEYYHCDAFRSLLLKSSISFISLWQYTKRPQIISQKFRLLADRLVSLQRKLKKKFVEIQPKCLTISLLYVSYLLQVARDSTQANGILQSLAFNEDFQINLQLDEKVFVQLTLEGQPMIFEKVGHNISLLLGFQKKEIQGQKIDLLLPQFYRKFHCNYVNDCFEQQFTKLYLQSKKTVSRNRWGYYEQCNVMLRLHFNALGELVLRGYLQIKPNPQYSWNNFLFISENQQILQCSQNFSDYAPSTSRLHKASQLFDEVKLYKTIIHRTADNLVEYHPLLVFETQAQKVFYYVRYVKDDTIGEIKQNVTQLLQTMQLRKFDWQFVKKYYLRVQDLLSNLYAKQYVLLALIAILSIGGLLALEGYFFTNARSQALQQQATMSTTKQVLSYYDTSIALGMRINFVNMRLGYGYFNTISVNNVINLSLTLQSNNQKLKGFTKNKYSLPSLIPGVTYSKPNYDMIVELLSNAYMIRQFSDDSFLQSTVLQRAQLSLYSIFANSIEQYQNNFVQSLRDAKPYNGDYIAIAGILVLLLILCIIIVRVQYRLRRDEQETLSLLTTIHNQDELIGTTRQFISKITREDTSSFRYQHDQQRMGMDQNGMYNSSFTPDITGREKDTFASRSEMSLREISGRDLLGDSFNNRSGVLQTAITSRIEQQQPQSFATQNQDINLTPRKRWIFGICIGLAMLIGGISLGNELQYNIKGQINILQSVSNIFTLFSTGSIFSRSMILFLNLICQRISGPISTIPFDTFMGNYTQSQIIVTFPQGTFDDFQPFQDILSQVTYQYMCTYINCDPNFANEVNIIYTTTIQKIIASAQTWKGELNSMNVSTLGSTVKNGTMTHFIDLIYYSQQIIRGQLLNMTNLYLNCFSQYSNNLMIKKRLLMGIALGMTVVSLLLLVGMLLYVVRHQGYLKDIAGLVKTNSYINDDSQIADRDAAKSNQQTK